MSLCQVLRDCLASAACTFLISSAEDLPPQRRENWCQKVTPGGTLQFSFSYRSAVTCNRPRTLSLQSFLPQVDEGGRIPLSFHHFFAAEDQDHLQGDAVIRLSALPKYGCIENTGTGTCGSFVYRTERRGLEGYPPLIKPGRGQPKRNGTISKKWKEGRKLSFTHPLIRNLLNMFCVPGARDISINKTARNHHPSWCLRYWEKREGVK